MIQTTPYGRRKKGPWSVLNRDSETKAVLYFSHHQFYKHWSCCPNLESRILFSVPHHHQYRKHSSWWQQLSKPWVKDVVFRINKDVGGKGADSNEERSTVPHQVLSSKKFHQFCQWSILVIITRWSIMIVSGHLSAFQVLEPFQSSYLGLPALDFC